MSPKLAGNQKTFIEFFAGIGLVRMGLELAGWQAVYANDIDPKKEEMYIQHFGTDEFDLGDIYNLDPKCIPQSVLATASFPCIDLSLAGNRAGLGGDHSGTFWGFTRVLEGMDNRPTLVMVENVVGLLTSDGGKDFRSLILALNELGYRCDAFVLNANHFVAQSRPRVFVIGAQGDIMPPMALLSARSHELLPDQLRRFHTANADLNWGEIPIPTPPTTISAFSNIIEELPLTSKWWWPSDKVVKTIDSMSEKHRQIANEMIAGSHVTYGTIYRRVREKITRSELRTDGIAGCLRTPRGGSSRQIVFAAGNGWCGVRFMTPREYARLQGVPDTYEISVPVNQALLGFGDAVCVPAIEWIGNNYLNVLLEKAMNEATVMGVI